MILVVGATGLVGSGVCRLLGSVGERVRGLVRASSDAAKVAQLREHGVDLVTGDLKDPASLARACAGVDTVISTASCTLSRQSGDSIETVDRNGQLALVDAAVAAGAKRFVFVSFPEVPVAFPLQDAKRAVEQRLRTSGLTYTILQPTFFAEIWLSPALGFDVAQGKARIYGTGTPRISWISIRRCRQICRGGAGQRSRSQCGHRAGRQRSVESVGVRADVRGSHRPPIRGRARGRGGASREPCRSHRSARTLLRRSDARTTRWGTRSPRRPTQAIAIRPGFGARPAEGGARTLGSASRPPWRGVAAIARA